MKKILVFILLVFALLIANSQALQVFEKNKDKPLVLLYSELDSITTEQNGVVPQQLFYTKDSLYVYNTADIDSVSFNLPYLKHLNIKEIQLPNLDFRFNFKFWHSYHYQIGQDLKLFEFKSDSDWLRCGFSYGSAKESIYNVGGNGNDANEDRTAYLYITTEYGTDTIKVTQYNNKYPYIGDYKWLNRVNYLSGISHTWQKRTHNLTIDEPFAFSGLSFVANGQACSECDWINYSISENKKTLMLYVDENKMDTAREVRIVPHFYPDMTLRTNNCTLIQHKTGVSTPEEQKQALIDLYNTMGGPNWNDNENWLSDRSLREWAGLYVGLSEDVMSISITGASGEFPASLAKIMDVADRIIISGNENWASGNLTYSINGKIPKEITQHPRWNMLGWEILFANKPAGKGIDMEGINLRMVDEQVTLIDNNASTYTSTAYEVLSRNKYTLIAISAPSDEMANVFLSYRNKGFGYVCAAQPWLGGIIDDVKITAKDYPLNVIFAFDSFANGSLGTGLKTLGSTFLVDSLGYVVDYENHYWGLSNSYYANRIDSILCNLLGEPEPHDPFVSTYYTSTDYSKDGEVITLQKATVGNGIDLVFMGDAYDDRDMAEGGLYETDMRKSMERFFEDEPYKSFRDRFNVYAVKVVSPNSHIGDGCKQTINEDNNICFNYASRIDGIDLDIVTIVNVVNNPNSFVAEGYTEMYESGASVAHIQIGGPSSIIVHEAGGHGFAKLLDEYIYSGYEGNYCPPENLESFKQWIKTDYHDRGWGMNIDTTNDPDSVVWSHFLKDTRYTGEVGIYQGAWYWPTDLWRASENSVMNSDYSTFNAPSREVIYKRIMQLSEGDDWVYDYEKFVEWDKEHQSSSSGGNSGSDTPDNPGGETPDNPGSDIPDTPNDPNLIVIDGISYEIIGNGNVRIVGNDGSLSGVVEVKSTIVGADGTTYNVTEIGTRAFADCPDLTVLDIHENIELFEEGYLEGNQQDLTIIMRSTNPPQFADPYYGFYKGYWTLKIPMSAYDLYEAMGWTGELKVVDINDDSNTPGNEPTTGANVWSCYYNDTNWDNSTVYVYVWDAGNDNKEYLGSWPGTPMTKNADGLWEMEFSTNDNLVIPMIIFNNGYSSGTNQTADLEFINNGIYNYDGYIKTNESTVEVKAKSIKTEIKPTVRQIKNHRIPKIIKGSPLNPQGEVAIPDFFNKTK